MSIETSSQTDVVTQQERGVVPPLTLGWRLQMALGHAGLTVQDMADELEMARSSLSRWLNGHGAAPRKVFVKQWALKCGVSYDWLQNGESPRPDEDPNGGSTLPHLDSNQEPFD